MAQLRTDFYPKIERLDIAKYAAHSKKVAYQISLGTIHLRRQHVLGGEGYPHVLMVQRSQYIRIKNPLHKHFAGMPMVGG